MMFLWMGMSLICSVEGWAQEKERVDSISSSNPQALPVIPLTPISPILPGSSAFADGTAFSGVSTMSTSVQAMGYPILIYLPYSPSKMLNHQGDYTTSGNLYRYRLGRLDMEGSQNSLPGLGRINQASLLWSHQINDRLKLAAAVEATQLNINFFHRHVVELKGQMSYKLSERLSLHLFANYDTGNPYDFYGRQWGGVLRWKITNRFGVDGGVRRRFNPAIGQWETVPIAAPYYMVHDCRLQIDLGPMIYDAIRQSVYGNQPKGNPTIAPPKNFVDIR